MSLKIPVLCSSKCDGVRRQSLLDGVRETIRARWGPEGRALMTGLAAVEEARRDAPLP